MAHFSKPPPITRFGLAPAWPYGFVPQWKHLIKPGGVNGVGSFYKSQDGTINGYTYMLNNSTVAPFRWVRLHERLTGYKVWETKSDENGFFEFKNLNRNYQYYVVLFDNVPEAYAAVALDMLVPELS